MAKTELLPCPFCGREELILESGFGDFDSHVICPTCGAMADVDAWRCRSRAAALTNGKALEEIQQAVARGWCHYTNAHKVMDEGLALAIADEVFAILTAAPIQAHSKTEYKRLSAQGANVLPPRVEPFGWVALRDDGYVDSWHKTKPAHGWGGYREIDEIVPLYLHPPSSSEPKVEPVAWQDKLAALRQGVNLIVSCADAYMAAVKTLCSIKDGKNLFEHRPSQDPEAYEAWIALNNTGARLRAVVNGLREVELPAPPSTSAGKEVGT